MTQWQHTRSMMWQCHPTETALDTRTTAGLCASRCDSKWAVCIESTHAVSLSITYEDSSHLLDPMYPSEALLACRRRPGPRHQLSETVPTSEIFVLGPLPPPPDLPLRDSSLYPSQSSERPALARQQQQVRPTIVRHWLMPPRGQRHHLCCWGCPGRAQASIGVCEHAPSSVPRMVLPARHASSRSFLQLESRIWGKLCPRASTAAGQLCCRARQAPTVSLVNCV